MPDRKVDVPRCPRCRKPPVRYVEWWDGFTMSFDTRAGVPESEGYKHDGYPSGKVVAECACGHEWRVRGVSQVTQLAGYEG